MTSFRQNKHHFCSMGSFHFSKHLLIGQCLCEWLECIILLQHPWYHFNLFCITYLALRPHLPILFSPHFVKQKVLQISEMLLKKTLFDYWSTMIIIVKSQCMRLQFINDFIIKSKILPKPCAQNYLQIPDLLWLCFSFLLSSTHTEPQCFSPLLPTKNSNVKDWWCWEKD